MHPVDSIVDGLAFSVAQAPAFALAVQWHPEMRTHDCPLAHAIFSAFDRACEAVGAIKVKTVGDVYVAFLASDEAKIYVGQTLGPNSGDVML